MAAWPVCHAPCVGGCSVGHVRGQSTCTSILNRTSYPTSMQVYSLSEQNRFYKQAAAFCLRAVAKHSPELAQVWGKGPTLGECREGPTLEKSKRVGPVVYAWSLVDTGRGPPRLHCPYVASRDVHHPPHTPILQAVIDSGSLDALVTCLEEFDPGVKEAAAWTLGYIAGHNAELAQQIVDAGAVPLLVLCVQV